MSSEAATDRPLAASVQKGHGVQTLRNPVRPYAWGSRTVIAELLGKPVPAPHPEAELWIGAHPADSSMLVDAAGERSLLDALVAEPESQLGVDCVRRWGPRLPFMLKILAADEPLSLQAHPSAELARQGYEREEAAGIPRDAPVRDYPDPMAKPELLCALSEFHALAGFRDVTRTVELLRALPSDALAHYTGLLAGAPDSDGLRALFTTWVTLPQSILDELVPEVLAACVEHVRAHGDFAEECRTVLELGEAYPNDAGVLCALLLNRITLQPGEAIFLSAGCLHAYLRGSGLEILGNSDNVLRCGLTPKHVNVPELLRVLDFAHGDRTVRKPEPLSANLAVYRTDAAEFELSTVHWSPGEREPVTLEHPGPQVLVCTDGAARMADGTPLPRGGSVWLAATDGPVTLHPATDGPVTVFRATAGML